MGSTLQPGHRPAGRGGGSCRLARRSCAFQALDDLVIACLREVHVELPDAKEVGWRLHAHELVGIGADSPLPARWCDGHGEYHAGRTMRPRDLTRRAGCGSRSDAVIDYHGDPPGQRLPVTTGTVALGAGFHLSLLPRRDRGQFLLTDPDLADDLGIYDLDSILPGCAHAEFRLERCAELADH